MKESDKKEVIEDDNESHVKTLPSIETPQNPAELLAAETVTTDDDNEFHVTNNAMIKPQNSIITDNELLTISMFELNYKLYQFGCTKDKRVSIMQRRSKLKKCIKTKPQLGVKFKYNILLIL